MPSSSPERSPPEEKFDVILIGIAARGLATAAHRAGLRALALDLFADEDTRRLASRTVRLRSHGEEFSIDPEDLEDALARHAPAGLPLIYGTGFEEMPGMVGRLAERYEVLGNSARTLTQLKEPRPLAALLHDLGIPHPRLFDKMAPDGVPTLEKRTGASGGGHVRPARHARGEPFYLQERIEGRTVSVLFLGNGQEARLLAFSEQWCDPCDEAEFRYGGAAGPIRLQPFIEMQVEEAVQRLVAATGLVGLASTDLIVNPQGWHLIEINPRPGATLDLFDRAPLPPLLRLHIDACRGSLPKLPLLASETTGGVSAAAVLYAPFPWEMRLSPLPDWAADRPMPGTHIASGEPICTVLAGGQNLEEARFILSQRLDYLRRDMIQPPRDAAGRDT